jgi:tetratricopeptide (TPR) repeat protein/predicted Ser/Thr protein kinase
VNEDGETTARFEGGSSRGTAATSELSSLADRVALAEAASALFGDTSTVRIGRYRILRQLGKGGYGSVYAAVDETLERTVAIKTLRSTATGDGDTMRQIREAQALARLRHPNAVEVFDVGMDPSTGGVFIAMEYVDGRTLRAWMGRSRRWRRVVEVFRQAAHGLVAIHDAGLVHRDFKPENVLIGRRGAVKVADFGLARAMETGDGSAPNLEIDGPLDLSVTATGTIVGTPAYMAPEILQGGRGDARSDQFSFCVALYEALYGRRPFAGRNHLALQPNVVAGRIRQPPKGSRVPPHVFDLVARGLQPDPDARWPSMHALADGLRHRSRRTRGFIAGAAASVALAVAATAWPWTTPTCEDAAPPWSAAIRVDVEPPLAGSTASSRQRFRRSAGDWSEAWVTANAEACRVHDDRRALARMCLTESKQRFEAVLAAVASDGADDARAHELLATLADPRRCLRLGPEGATPPPPAAVAGDVAALRDRLASALVGPDPATTTTALQALLAGAERLAYDPLTAEVLAALGSAQFAAAASDDAVTTLERALSLARDAPAPELVAEIGIRLCKAGAQTETTFERARRRCDEAIATARRVDRPDLVLEARSAGAGAASKFGQFALARDELGEILAQQRELARDGDVPVLETITRLAVACEMSGEAQRAVELNRELVDGIRELRGPRHFTVRVPLLHLGTSLVAVGRPEEALGPYTESLELCRAAYGKASPACRNALIDRGDAFTQLGRREDALADLEAAIAIPADGSREDHQSLLAARINLGVLELHHDDLRAHAELGRVADDALASLGEYDSTTIKAIESVGIAALFLGRHDEADRWLSRARTAADRAFGASGRDTLEIQLWSVRLELARDDRDAARALLARVRITAQTDEAILADYDALRQELGPTSESCASTPSTHAAGRGGCQGARGSSSGHRGALRPPR